MSCKTKVFKIPVEWVVCGFAMVEAENIEDAIDMVQSDQDKDGNPFPLPDDSDYIDGSFCVSPGYSVEEIESLYN